MATSPYLNPEPVEQRSTSGTIVYYWNPTTGQMYAVEVGGDVDGDGESDSVPKLDEFFRDQGFVPYVPGAPVGTSSPAAGPNADLAPQPGTGTPDTSQAQPITRDALSESIAAWEEARAKEEQRAAEDAQQAAIDALRDKYGLDERAMAALSRQEQYLRESLSRDRRLAALANEERDLKYARTEQSSRFQDALRFNGQEYWRARTRAKDQQLADSAAALQLDDKQAALDYQLAGIGDQRAKVEFQQAAEQVQRSYEDEIDRIARSLG